MVGGVRFRHYERQVGFRRVHWTIILLLEVVVNAAYPNVILRSTIRDGLALTSHFPE
jgi:hypothetical protein